MSKDFLFPAHISLDGDGSAAAHYDVVNHPFGSGPIRHIIYCDRETVSANQAGDGSSNSAARASNNDSPTVPLP
jgi:hypothetical protein